MTSAKTLILAVVICLLASIPAKSADRDYWISRYLSVSYPLKSIKVNSKFGTRKDPFTGEQANHSGIDLQAHYEEVYAMFDGIVQKVGSDGRSGNFITIRHGEYTVSYCHLSKAMVAEGEEVFAGDPVAISGNTGRSTGPHLHITCKYKGQVTDPYTLLVYIKEVRAEAVAALGGTVMAINPSAQVDRKAFFDRFAYAAMEQQQRYGIPASVTLAQMAFESFWGQSRLAMTGNNFFGIKCSKAWLDAGKPYSLHHDERPNEKFCNYATVDESIEHHSRVLMGNRYKRCRRYASTDYHNWLVAIKACGYASAPNYVKKCESIIKKYKLYLYDRIALRA